MRVYYAFDLDAEDKPDAMKKIHDFLPDNPEWLSYFGVGAKRIPCKENCGDCDFLDDWGCCYAFGDWIACYKDGLPRTKTEGDIFTSKPPQKIFDLIPKEKWRKS